MYTMSAMGATNLQKESQLGAFERLAHAVHVVIRAPLRPAKVAGAHRAHARAVRDRARLLRGLGCAALDAVGERKFDRERREQHAQRHGDRHAVGGGARVVENEFEKFGAALLRRQQKQAVDACTNVIRIPEN